MSVDLFACHAVKNAALQGDMDMDSALILSLMPKANQESALRQMLQLPELVTPVQLLKSIESRSLDLSKAKFDRSNCKSCLHNTANANAYIGAIGEMSPGRCLYILCAQHDAQDAEILKSRTLVPKSHVDEPEPAAPVADEQEHSMHSPTPSDERHAEHDEPLAEQAQFDLTSIHADIGEVDHSDAQYEPQAPADYIDEADAPSASAQAEPEIQGTSESNPVIDTVTEPVKPADTNSYIDQVRNVWWRDALTYRVAHCGTVVEMQSFLLACLATGFKMESIKGESPVTLFIDLASGQVDVLPEMVSQVILQLPLEVVGSFINTFGVDLRESGTVSLKLLQSLSLEELVEIANDLAIDSTDQICDAYDAGNEAFAQAIFNAAGPRRMAEYIPHSLRP